MDLTDNKLFTLQGFHITQLHADDQAELQTLLENCADYSFLVTGLPPKPSAAVSLLKDCPPGKTLADKLLIGIATGNKVLVGVLDAVRDYPAQDDWWLGLLLLEPAHRKKGLGRQIYLTFEHWASQQGARRIYLGVLKDNAKAFRFWQSLGFKVVERQPARQLGNRTHVVIIMAHTISEV